MVPKLVPDLFLKSQNWEYLQINSLSFHSFLLSIVCQVEDYRNRLKLSCIPLAFTLYKAFLKNKTRSGTSLPVSFSECFFKKCVLLLYSSLVVFYYPTKFHHLVAFASWNVRHYVSYNCLLTRLWLYKF